ncbi:adenosylcobinamide-GDP ribazoletransferase [Metabacillus sp. 84]|uniref:adenosylcobinamide-GDP ribazoletransferase n=1 Tax=Metabacillus sp. 84 TaxID=3404705 RepID=UPI003CEA2006
MKKGIDGFLIGVQFFTVLPVKKRFDMDPKRTAIAIQCLPAIGLLMGSVQAALLWLLQTYTPLSALACAFIIWLSAIMMTGGLHLDGWMDSSDAYFSYRDRDKRLEIMKDPRIGAFGVLSVLVLLFAKFLFIYEVIERFHGFGFSLLALIPMLSRTGMGLLLASVPSVKKDGLSYFFQKGLQWRRIAGSYAISVTLVACLLGLFEPVLVIYLIGLLLMSALFTLASGLFFKKEFGGITGDLLGASSEGGEVFLWMGLWLLHYYVMG